MLYPKDKNKLGSESATAFFTVHVMFLSNSVEATMTNDTPLYLKTWIPLSLQKHIGYKITRLKYSIYSSDNSTNFRFSHIMISLIPWKHNEQVQQEDNMGLTVHNTFRSQLHLIHFIQNDTWNTKNLMRWRRLGSQFKTNRNVHIISKQLHWLFFCFP